VASPNVGHGPALMNSTALTLKCCRWLRSRWVSQGGEFRRAWQTLLDKPDYINMELLSVVADRVGGSGLEFRWAWQTLLDKCDYIYMELLSVVAEQVVVGAGNQQHVS